MKEFFQKIKDFFLSLEQMSYIRFIIGMSCSAFFSISLKMFVCIVPTLFLAFIIEFVKAFRGGEFSGKELLTYFIGGAVIQIFALL